MDMANRRGFRDKLQITTLIVLLFLLTGSAGTRNQGFDLSAVLYLEEDKEIIEKAITTLSGEKDSDISALMVKVGTYFLGTPYVAHTLETGEEQLVINLREMDCTTFAEYCLALSLTLRNSAPSFEHFAAELEKIRYRFGTVEGYSSRLHYFCDWIYQNEQKGLVKDLSREIAHSPLTKKIDFMSTHPDSYGQLKENPALVKVIALQEEEISKREMYYIPKSMLAEVEGKLREGDLVGITTGVEGLAISHVGILMEKSGRIHLLHASSAAGKVLISDTSLEAYLVNSKSATGIMVVRPQ